MMGGNQVLICAVFLVHDFNDPKNLSRTHTKVFTRLQEEMMPGSTKMKFTIILKYLQQMCTNHDEVRKSEFDSLLGHILSCSKI